MKRLYVGWWHASNLLCRNTRILERLSGYMIPGSTVQVCTKPYIRGLLGITRPQAQALKGVNQPASKKHVALLG
jgi:hypothetical protein